MLSMSRCQKHGICKHETRLVCSECAAENSGTQPRGKTFPNCRISWEDLPTNNTLSSYPKLVNMNIPLCQNFLPT